MKKLVALFIIMALLGICSPSYGYILVYKVTGSLKAVEWNSNALSSVSVKGYLALDINDTNDADVDANMVLYGKNAAGALKYYLDGLSDTNNADNGIAWNNSGMYVGLDAWNLSNPHRPEQFQYEFVVTGKVKSADVGLGTGTLRPVVSSLKGSMISWWGQIFDAGRELYGTGAASMALDTKQTKAANAANVVTPGSVTVTSIITAFITSLQSKGYTAL
jgi:hypothetical protein